MTDTEQPKFEKTVIIGIKMDFEFISALRANVELSSLKDKDELTPLQQLGLLVLMEARGAMPEQVHASILHSWRPHLEAISEIRKVE